MTTAETVERTREALRKKGYAFFEAGDYNLNIIGVRNKQIFDNKFSDRLILLYKVNGIWRTLETAWTTLAGTAGKGGEQNPLTAQETGTGVSGTAVIIPNQYRRVYKFVDNYFLWLSYPYFAQVNNMQYWRDNDKNGKITKGKIYSGNYATNLHRMSNNNEPRTVINDMFVAWSQGCNGSPEPEYKKILPIVRESVKRYGDIFTYTLLDKEDF
jgi:hypothetical protein